MWNRVLKTSVLTVDYISQSPERKSIDSVGSYRLSSEENDDDDENSKKLNHFIITSGNF